jgi:hypothetical protein
MTPFRPSTFIEGSFCQGDPRAPKPGTRVQYRRCDETAQALSGAEGLPSLELYWNKADRDAAIARCKEILNRYGDRFRYARKSPLGVVGFWPERAALVLPILDHPATSKEVEAGRAVFTLADVARGRPVRVWPDFTQPTQANWLTLKAHPVDVQSSVFDPKTGQSTAVKDRIYEQSGTVYQAEEVQTDKGWQRFYGFVGQNDIAQVPAEEIQFPAPATIYWRDLSNGIACSLSRPGIRLDIDRAKPISLGMPVSLSLEFWNTRGTSQTLPAHFISNKGSIISLRPGLTFVAGYTSRPPVEFEYPFFVPEEIGSNGAPWQALSPKPIGAWPATDQQLVSANRSLQPAKSFEALSLDLRDLFDLSRPGAYWVCVKFDGSLETIGKGASAFVTFRIAPAQAGG